MESPGNTGVVAVADDGQEPHLSPVGAFFNALLGRSLAHYPRFRTEARDWKKVPDADLIQRVVGELRLLEAKDDTLKDAVALGRETLDEVKELTEYQDQKATRLLTIITFLSALSGILFSRFVEGYPLHASLAQGDLQGWQRGLVVASYVSFGIFVLFAVCGALVVFHATRTQFRYPDIEAGNRDRANSYLFYKSIIEVTPEAWAKSFLKDGSQTEVAPNLQLRYLRNYIVESYLVAAKVAEKLRYLQPAQQILSRAIRVLLIWLLLLATTIVFVPVKNEPSTSVSTTSSAVGTPPASELPRSESVKQLQNSAGPATEQVKPAEGQNSPTQQDE